MIWKQCKGLWRLHMRRSKFSRRRMKDSMRNWQKVIRRLGHWRRKGLDIWKNARICWIWLISWMQNLKRTTLLDQRPLLWLLHPHPLYHQATIEDQHLQRGIDLMKSHSVNDTNKQSTKTRLLSLRHVSLPPCRHNDTHPSRSPTAKDAHLSTNDKICQLFHSHQLIITSIHSCRVRHLQSRILLPWSCHMQLIHLVISRILLPLRWVCQLMLLVPRAREVEAGVVMGVGGGEGMMGGITWNRFESLITA